MSETARAQQSKGRAAFRKIWWMRFWLPVIALGTWWYFTDTAVTAYHYATEGVVVPAEVTKTNTFRRTESITVRYVTTEGRQIETTVVPKTCRVKQPGTKLEVRYIASDPTIAQDTCDPPRHGTSWVALLAAVGLSALSVQTWRLWVRHRKTGQLPPQYPM